MPLWIRVGRPCWHIATAQRAVIAAICHGYLVVKVPGVAGVAGRLTAKPHEIRSKAPVVYRPRMKRAEPLIVDGRPYTEDELRTAAAWKISPDEVRRIRQEGKHV